MDGLIPLWISSVFCAIGVVYAIVRNGSRQKKQDEQLKAELKTEIGAIKKQLDDPVNGLSAIKESSEAMKLHCAEVSTAISAQVKTNTDEITLLRKKER